MFDLMKDLEYEKISLEIYSSSLWKELEKTTTIGLET
jgi:hypothetical protein